MVLIVQKTVEFPQSVVDVPVIMQRRWFALRTVGGASDQSVDKMFTV